MALWRNAFPAWRGLLFGTRWPEAPSCAEHDEAMAWLDDLNAKLDGRLLSEGTGGSLAPR